MRELSQILYHLTPAVDRSHGRYETGDVIARCLDGTMQMWASVNDKEIESVCVTQFLNFPRARVVSMPFVGGQNIKNWLKFSEDIIKWAKERGATQIEGYDCRNGAWLRVTDWQEKYITIGKPI